MPALYDSAWMQTSTSQRCRGTHCAARWRRGALAHCPQQPQSQSWTSLSAEKPLIEGRAARGPHQSRWCVIRGLHAECSTAGRHGTLGRCLPPPSLLAWLCVGQKQFGELTQHEAKVICKTVQCRVCARLLHESALPAARFERGQGTRLYLILMQLMNSAENASCCMACMGCTSCMLCVHAKLHPRSLHAASAGSTACVYTVLQ